MFITLDLCEKYFKTRDLYKVLGISKDAQEKDIRKAYHKLSLVVHPDRVSEAQKPESSEKFKVLSQIYQVLKDPKRRALYDEQANQLAAWMDFWVEPITVVDVDRYEQEYIGSFTEREDIKKAYLDGEGCINYMINNVPFMEVKDEPRIKEIVRRLIAFREVPEYKIFTEEPASKRNRRHRKYAREL